MQDIHAIGGGAGRLFTTGDGGVGVGDRRLRPNSHQNHQPLKCPRCDSLNTKFCYYNNYNLSQPRHFCKSCRRYWTKGGVLRSVPVGGGCRKSKRSKPKPSSSAIASPIIDVVQQEQKSNSHSSSESSSLTGATTTATANATAGASMEVLSAKNSNFLNFSDSSTFFISQNSTDHPSFDNLEEPGQIFPDIGSFTNMMTSSSEPALMGFSSVDISNYRLQLQNEEPPLTEKQPEQEKPVEITTSSHDHGVLKMPEMNTTGYLDHIDFSLLQQQNRGSNGVFSSVTGCGEQGMFDFTGGIDQTYWNSQTQWPDHDHSLHFLP